MSYYFHVVIIYEDRDGQRTRNNHLIKCFESDLTSIVRRIAEETSGSFSWEIIHEFDKVVHNEYS